MRRPLFWFSAFFLAALAFFLLFEGSFRLLSAACAVLLFCLLMPGPFASQHKGMLLAGGLACLAALGAAQRYQAKVDRWVPLVGQTADFTGWVREEDPYLPGRGKVQGTLRLEEGGEATDSVLLDIRGMGEGLTPGGWVSGRLLISQVRRDGNARGGVSLYCVALGEAEDVPAPPGLHPLADMAAFRWKISQRVWDRYRDQPAAVVLAMVFSRQDLLPQSVLEQMSRAGLRHLLVVSGLHLSMAVGWILTLFRWPRREKRLGGLEEPLDDLEGRVDGPGEQTGELGERIGTLAALAAVWILAGLAGFSVSVVRAASMSSLWLLGRCLKYRADSLTSLAFSALLLAAITPPVMLQTGYQLSFLATFGVLLGSGSMTEGLCERWKTLFHRVGPLSRRVLEGLSVSLCAQLGTLPVLAAVYGQFSLLGLFTTLLAMPFAAGIILLGGVGCLLLSVESMAVPGRLLLVIARGLARCILALADLTDRLPLGMVPVLLPYQWVLCLLVPAAVFGYLGLRPWIGPHTARMLRRRAALAAMVVVLYHIAYYSQGTVLICSSGNTGAVVISAPGGTLVLAQGEDSYYHRAVSSQLLRCGASGPLALVCPWDSSANSILWWRTALSPVFTVAPEEETTLLQNQQTGEYFPLTGEPAEVLPGILVSHPAPEITCVEVSGRKVLKSWAGYGIIAGKPLEGDLLIDMEGRVYPLSSGLNPGRMFTGDTNLLLPAGTW